MLTCSSCRVAPATIMATYPTAAAFRTGDDRPLVRQEPFCAACWGMARAMANTQYTTRPIVDQSDPLAFPNLFDAEDGDNQ